ncbi:hypothetical protein LIA77_06891 [Sarocladium implicatum]|nr:hypothetical protein LIA77_06891 [Sarocladium implicatum]
MGSRADGAFLGCYERAYGRIGSTLPTVSKIPIVGRHLGSPSMAHLCCCLWSGGHQNLRVLHHGSLMSSCFGPAQRLGDARHPSIPVSTAALRETSKALHQIAHACVMAHTWDSLVHNVSSWVTVAISWRMPLGNPFVIIAVVLPPVEYLHLIRCHHQHSRATGIYGSLVGMRSKAPGNISCKPMHPWLVAYRARFADLQCHFCILPL